MPIFFDDNGTRRKYTTLVQQIHGNGVSAVPQPMLPLLTGNILSTFPVAMEPGKSYTGKVSGVTSNIGTVKYKILPISSAVALVFSKTENISAEELFTISVLNNATENSKVSFLIEANTSTPASNGPMTLPIGISIFKNNTTPDATSVIWNISQTNFEESKTIEFSISGGTDPENDGLTYQLSTENNRVSFNKTTNISSTDKVTMNVGAYPDTTEKVFISVVNSKGVVSTNKKTYTLNITAKPLSNTPPNASTIVWTGLSQYQEEGTYTVAFSGGSDAETTTGMTYEITNILPVNGISFSKTVGITQNESITLTTPTVSADTAVSFELKCRDASDALSTNSVTLNLTVKNKITANQAPSSSTITSNFPSSINENTSTNTFTISGGSDPEGSALTYRIVIDKPTVLTFSKTTGIVANEAITITAANINSDTSVTLSIYAVDALGTESTSAKTFTTTVKYSNIAPNMTNFTTSLLGSSVNEGTNNQVIFSGASDPEGQQITYEITSIPPELTFGKTTGITDGEIISVSVSSVTATKSVTFAVYAKDSTGAMSETKNITVTINDSNNAPNSTNIIWTGGTTINESSSKSVSFSGATDPDGDTVTYEISNISNSALSFSKTSGITTSDLVTITASSVNSNTTITFDVKARDSKNAVSTAKSFSITVTNVNSAPSASNISWTGTTTINENSNRAIYFSGATDPDNDTLTYQISNISNSVLSFSKTSFSSGELITMIAGAVTSNTSVSFRVTVSDGTATSFKDFSITVNKVNSAPSASNIILTGTTTINENSNRAIYFSGATDPDNDTLTYQISNISNSVLSFSKTSFSSGELITMIAGAVTSTTSVSFMVTVTDSNGASDSKTFSVSVLDVQTVSISNLFIRGAENGAVSGLSVGYVYSPIWVNVKSDYKGVIGLDITATNGKEYVTLEKTNTTIDNTNGNGGSFLINKFHVPRTHNATFVTIVVTPYITTSGGSRIYGDSNSVSVYFNKENADIGAHLSLSYQFYLSDTTQLIKTITKTGTSAVGDLSTLPKNTWITIKPTINSGIGGILQTVRASGNCILRIRNPSFGINYVLDSSADSYSKAIGLFDTSGTYVEFYSTGTGILTFGLTEQAYGKCGAEAQFIF